MSTRGSFRGSYKRGGAATGHRGGQGGPPSIRGKPRTPGTFGGRPRSNHDDRPSYTEKRRNENRQKAAEFIGKAREEFMNQKRSKQRSESKTEAKKSRLDRKVKNIVIGKQKWTESTDESTYVKLSCKIFGGHKRSIKITIDTRTNGNVLKYRTDITFDDITWCKLHPDGASITFKTRIPTLFEIGKQVKDADGAFSIAWTEGLDLPWQQASRNPDPNRYHIEFADGAFTKEHMVRLVGAGDRLSKLILNSSPKLKELIETASNKDDSMDVDQVGAQESHKKSSTSKKEEVEDGDSDSSLDAKPKSETGKSKAKDAKKQDVQRDYANNDFKKKPFSNKEDSKKPNAENDDGMAKESAKASSDFAGKKSKKKEQPQKHEDRPKMQQGRGINRH